MTCLSQPIFISSHHFNFFLSLFYLDTSFLLYPPSLFSLFFLSFFALFFFLLSSPHPTSPNLTSHHPTSPHITSSHLSSLYLFPFPFPFSFFVLPGSIIVKPTIVESQLLRSGSSKGSLNSHLLSKYRACLEACFEQEELKEYINKEHSFLLNSQKEYSLQDNDDGRGRVRGREEGRDGDNGSDRDRNFHRNHDLSRSSLPDWLIEGRGHNNSDDNIYNNNNNNDNCNNYNDYHRYYYNNYDNNDSKNNYYHNYNSNNYCFNNDNNNSNNNNYSNNNNNHHHNSNNNHHHHHSSISNRWSEINKNSANNFNGDHTCELMQKSIFHHQTERKKSFFNEYESSGSREIGWLPSKAEKKYSDFPFLSGKKGSDNTYSTNSQWWQ